MPTIGKPVAGFSGVDCNSVASPAIAGALLDLAARGATAAFALAFFLGVMLASD